MPRAVVKDVDVATIRMVKNGIFGKRCLFPAKGGKDFALGSLYSTEKTNLTTQERINFALEAAAKFSAGVRPPFISLKIGEKKTRTIKK